MTEKRREYFKKYREEHKAEFKEYNKKYREEHRAELREYRKRYYHENKEKERASKKRYYSNPENHEKVRENARLYYQQIKNDPEYIAKNRAKHAKWQRENKDEFNAYKREYRKRKRLEAKNNATEA